MGQCFWVALWFSEVLWSWASHTEHCARRCLDTSLHKKLSLMAEKVMLHTELFTGMQGGRLTMRGGEEHDARIS